MCRANYSKMFDLLFFYVSITRAVVKSRSRIFEAHHDPCSLIKGEATFPSPEKSPKNCIQFLSRSTPAVRRDELYSSYVWHFPRRYFVLNLNIKKSRWNMEQNSHQAQCVSKQEAETIFTLAVNIRYQIVILFFDNLTICFLIFFLLFCSYA